MTTDEAIEYLKRVDEFMCSVEKHMPGCCYHNSEPIEMAIEALEFKQEELERQKDDVEREQWYREEREKGKMDHEF